MILVKCKICRKEFNIKPSHLKLGWGKYCSRDCTFKGQLKGISVKCHICGMEIYRSKSNLSRSASKKYFCTKSCQTLWRNSTFTEERSSNWINGKSSYRNILKRSGLKTFCVLCKISDERVLSAHHKDHNRSNNKLKNLTWLCLNCHYLVHHDKDLDKKVMEALV